MKYPPISTTPNITRFTTHITGMAILGMLTADTFPLICKQYDQSFIYGSAADLGLGTDESCMFWAYQDDMMGRSKMARLTPIL